MILVSTISCPSPFNCVLPLTYGWANINFKGNCKLVPCRNAIALALLLNLHKSLSSICTRKNKGATAPINMGAALLLIASPALALILSTTPSIGALICNCSKVVFAACNLAWFISSFASAFLIFTLARLTAKNCLCCWSLLTATPEVSLLRRWNLSSSSS